MDPHKELIKYGSHKWFRKQMIKLTLQLYKCQHISDRKGVTKIIEMFDNFINECSFVKIKYDVMEKQKPDKLEPTSKKFELKILIS